MLSAAFTAAYIAATVDALTGVQRPDAFWDRAEILTHELTLNHKPWVFAYLDLDHF